MYFTKEAWNDYLYWQTQEKKILKRINRMIEEIQRTPYEGIGKPEALKFNFAGAWSRRITQEHRLIYMIKDEEIFFLSFMDHYE